MVVDRGWHRCLIKMLHHALVLVTVVKEQVITWKMAALSVLGMSAIWKKEEQPTVVKKVSSVTIGSPNEEKPICRT